MPEVDLSVETDEATASSLRSHMESVTGKEIIQQKRENLGGMVADFVTILEAVSPIVAAVMPFVTELARQRKVRRIKLGDVEIENPTDQQVRAIWARIQATDPH